jgi:hypothetical protein
VRLTRDAELMDWDILLMGAVVLAFLAFLAALARASR